MVQSGKMRLDSILDVYRPAVKALLADGGLRTDARKLFLQQQREAQAMARDHAKARAAAGVTGYRPRQEVYTDLVRTHLDGCEDGLYPPSTKSAQAVAGNDAPRLIRKAYCSKQLRTALRDNQNHPGMQRVNSVADKSTIAAIVGGKVSTCLGVLTTSHKLAVRLERLERGQKLALQQALEAKSLAADAVARTRGLEARRNIEDAGGTWQEAALRIRQAEPSVSQREVARRVGVSEGALRKHLRCVAGSN